MRALFSERVGPLLRSWYGERLAPLEEHTIRTSGVSESVLAEMMEDLDHDAMGRCDLAYLPQLGGVDLRVSGRGASPQLARAVDEVRRICGRFVYGEGSEDLEEVVLRELASHGARVAVAESCTGGLILERLTRAPGASHSVLGGVVAYHDDVKGAVLGVDRADLARFGAVSEPVVIQMADGAARVAGAELGLGISGIAGPGGGTEAKPVGTVCYAVHFGGETRARTERFSGDREAIRFRSAQALLRMALDVLRMDGRSGEREPPS
jgi:nicotinamide-nucleotide amidase